MSATPETKPPAPERHFVAEVRYSLPAMLEEVKAEKAASGFAMEKLDQTEIGKLFKAKTPRAKSKK